MYYTFMSRFTLLLLKMYMEILYHYRGQKDIEISKFLVIILLLAYAYQVISAKQLINIIDIMELTSS